MVRSVARLLPERNGGLPADVAYCKMTLVAQGMGLAHHMVSETMSQPQTILCPDCHKENVRNAQYCRHCGHDMVLNNAGPRYYITRVLKAGGQGAVYETVGDDGQTYAVKEMLDRFDNAQQRQEAIARFEAEAQLLQCLHHPRIPRVYAHFEDEKRHYLVMDFVVGEDLEDIIEREGAIPEPQVLAWADQISDVLGYLHANGLIYRDMKPSNIMTDTVNGGIKLVDFGIAKVLQPATRGTQIGTPGYAPPEQYQGLATPASDIYALAATLHHLLTGRDPTAHPPFSYPAVRHLKPDVSQRTSDAIARALQMKPEDRFASVNEFRQALGFRPGVTIPRISRSIVSPVSNRTSSQAAASPMPHPYQQPIPDPAFPPLPAPAPAQPAVYPRTMPVPNPQPAPPTPAIPQPAPPHPRGRWRGCLFTLTGVVLVLALLGVVYVSLFDMPPFPFLIGPQPTAQTFVLQTFTAENLEVTVPNPTDDLVAQAFLREFEQAARNEYGAGVQIRPGTLIYLQAPVEIGQEQQGVRYRASVRGDILIPQETDPNNPPAAP